MHATDERWFGGWGGGPAAVAFIVAGALLTAMIAAIGAGFCNKNAPLRQAGISFALALMLMSAEVFLYVSVKRILMLEKQTLSASQDLPLLDAKRPVTITSWIGTGTLPTFKEGHPLDVTACVADQAYVTANRIRAYVWGNVPNSITRVTLAESALEKSGRACPDGRTEFKGELTITDAGRVHPRSIMLVVGEGHAADQVMLEQASP